MVRIFNREINRIIATGCSVTYGQGLNAPLTEAWPAKLASMFSIECVNLGSPGMGNEYVSSSLIDYFAVNNDHKKDSFVIPCFTKFSRVELPPRQLPDFLPMGKNWTTILKSTIEPEFTQMFFKNFYNEKYYYNRYLRIIISLQKILTSWNIPYVMCEGLKNERSHNVLSLDSISQKLIDQIDQSMWFSFFEPAKVLIDLENRLPCNHPNAFAHEEFSKMLYQHIINRYETEKI